jgi:hypothetical protein
MWRRTILSSQSFNALNFLRGASLRKRRRPGFGSLSFSGPVVLTLLRLKLFVVGEIRFTPEHRYEIQT